MSTRPPSFPPRSAPPARESVSGDVAVVDTDVRDDRDDRAGATVDVRRPSGALGSRRVSDGLADRLEERRRARRRLRVRAVIAVGVLVLLVAGLGVVTLASPVLALRSEDVTIEGATDVVDEAALLAAVEQHEDEPLLRIDTPALREELLGVVGVLDVTIRRVFPHGLDITVDPRVPVATVKEDGRFVLLDSEGVELVRTKNQPDGVPLVRVPVGTSDTAPALAAVLDVMAALPPELLDRVSDASAKTAYEVEFELDSGARVVWGTADDDALKAEVLTQLLQVPAQVYDVSAPLSPITR